MGRRVADGYQMAIAVPWSLFPEFEPGPGAVLGMDIAIDDSDGPEKMTARLDAGAEGLPEVTRRLDGILKTVGEQPGLLGRCLG